MASRREQKEALRREREERERQAKAAQARKRLVGYGAAGVLVLVVVIVVGVVALGGGGEASVDAQVLPDGGSVPEQKQFDLAKAAAAAGCEVKSVKASGSFDHTTDPNERVKYNSNPPTSGRHFVQPVDDGAYTTAPTDEQLVHNLEHGRVIIWFQPSLPKATRADLKALFDADSYQMLLVPRTKMPYRLASSAWNGTPAPTGRGRLLLCKQVKPEVWDALRAFRDENRSNGPEAIP